MSIAWAIPLCLFLLCSVGCEGEDKAPVIVVEGGCSEDEDCPEGFECEEGTCIVDACVGDDCPCTRDGDCAGGLVCDLGTGDCFDPACLRDQDCALGQRCVERVCLTDAEADRDVDGIPDGRDICPEVADAEQLDNDSDGQGDACDLDDDNDAVPDTVDNCPLAPNPIQGDANSDGVGNACDQDAPAIVVRGSLDFSAFPRADTAQAQVFIAGRGESVAVSAEGQFVFEPGLAEPGRFEIRVDWPGFAVLIEAFEVPDGQALVELAPLVMTPLVADRRVEIRGQIRLDGQTNHRDIIVRARSGADLVDTTATDSDGVFVLRTPETDITLGFSKAGFAPLEIALTFNLEGDFAGRFTLDGVPVEEVVDLTLAALLGSLSVSVTVRPDWIPQDQRAASVTLAGPGQPQTLLVDGGAAVFADLPLARYTATAARVGFSGGSQSVFIDPQGLTVDLTLDIALQSLSESGLLLAGLTLTGEEVRAVPDVSGADFGGVIFVGANPPLGADLSGLVLSNVSLVGADLDGADLRRALLSGADLSGSNLVDADLLGADLDGAVSHGVLACPARTPASWVCRAQPSNGRFALIGPNANLSGANLTEVDLTGADLSGVDLSGVDLSGAVSHGLIGCPAQAPTGWVCRAQPSNGRFALIGPNANLSGADLSGIDLTGVDLTGADLTGSNLSGVNLTGVDLTGLDLLGANLDGAVSHGLIDCPAQAPTGWVCRAQPGNGRFALIGPNANLSGADLTGADLTGVILLGVDLTGADLLGANLDGAVSHRLVGCPAQAPVGWVCRAQPSNGRFALIGPNANLSGADLTEVDLTGVSLRGINFVGANLTGVNLADVDLTGIDFTGVDFTGANFTGVTLTGTNLTDANLTGVDLTGAAVEALAGCPATPPARWICTAQPSTNGFVLLGPGVNLADADLSRVAFDGADLEGVDLSGANLDQAQTHGLVACAGLLPDPWVCRAQPSDGRFALLGPNADLSGAVLSGTDLTGIDLTNARFNNADLSAAVLAEANLSGADLTGAILNLTLTADLAACPAALSQDARCIPIPETPRFAILAPGVALNGIGLDRIQLDGIDLNGAVLSGASLFRAALTGTNLAGINLSNALLALADLTSADLTGADLTGATMNLINLTDANLSVADLSGANLANGVLTGTNLNAANLVGASLVLSNMTGADLTGADLSNVDLTGADLTGAVLTGANLTGARTVELVACPAALPAGWLCLPVSDGTFVLLGPGANLGSGGLNGLGLSGVDLSAVDLSSLDLRFTVGLDNLQNCPLGLPPEWVCRLNPNTDRFVLLGPGANLGGVDLRGFVFGALNLTRANLVGADLGGADMSETNLRFARTHSLVACPNTFPVDRVCRAQPATNGLFALLGAESDLNGANLTDADLSGVVLTGSELSDAQMIRADLRGAGLVGTVLAGADMTNADLTGAVTHSLVSCPTFRPDAQSWECRDQPANSTVMLLGPGIDLSGVDLTGADLTRLVLDGVDLTGANLAGSDMTGTLDLFGATTFDLLACPAFLPDTNDVACRDQPANGRFALFAPGVNLSGADLSGAGLAAVNLSDAELRGTDLSGANLRFAVLERSDMTDAILAGAVTYDVFGCPQALPGGEVNGVPVFFCRAQPDTQDGRHVLLGPNVNLSNAVLSGVDFVEANLTGANFTDADLSRTNMALVNLTGATLIRANLTEVFIPDATLLNANFSFANFTNADLTSAIGVNLTGANLTGAVFTNTKTGFLTNCPAQLSPFYRCLAKINQPGFLIVGPSVDLNGVVFEGMTGLAGTNFFSVSLVGANFIGIDLTGANFVGADLNSANFDLAILDNVDFKGADLSGAFVGERTSLTGTRMYDLVGCPTIEGVVFDTRDLRCVRQPDNLGFALLGPRLDLNGAVLSTSESPLGEEVDLLDIRNSDLRDTAWLFGSLNGVDFDFSNMVRANFFGASLTDVTFINADLTNANFGSTTLIRVVFSPLTICPQGVTEADLPDCGFNIIR